jgi:hypothetical protein
MWLVSVIPRSPIYTASIEHSHQSRFLAMVDANRAGNIPDAASLDVLFNGCTTEKSEGIKRSVGFARFFLFTTCDIQRAAYLMKDVKNFLHLVRWIPTSKLCYLEAFVTDETQWNRVSLNIIVRGSHFLAKAGSSVEGAKLMDFVVNPTVKKVLLHFQELRQLMVCGGEESVGMKNILRNVLLEMFASKLGTTITIDLTDQQIADISQTANMTEAVNADMKSKVRKIVSAHCSKTVGMNVHFIILHGLVNTYINCGYTIYIRSN